MSANSAVMILRSPSGAPAPPVPPARLGSARPDVGGCTRGGSRGETGRAAVPERGRHPGQADMQCPIVSGPSLENRDQRGIVCQEEGVRLAKEFDEVGHDLFNGGLSSHHRIGDAVYLLDVRGNRYMRIDDLLEGGELKAVEAKAYGANVDQSVNNWLEAGGFAVERQKGDVGETWLGMSHEPSRPFPGAPLPWKTGTAVH
jgi:hypothetical protein